MNGHIATQDERRSFAQAVAIREGAVRIGWINEQIMALRGANTEVIDLGNRTVIPGLNDSQMHPIRGGLNYNMELRLDGVPSLADALRMLKEQAQRTPPPQWVRVVGGWTEFQFAERRMPTLEVFQNGVRSACAYVLRSSCPTKSPSGIVWLRSTAYWTTRFRRLPHGSNERADPYRNHPAR
jgi:predicted amidohydrolase YtcJ